MCIVLIVTSLCLPIVSQVANTEDDEIVRTGLTLAGAAAGLAAGSLIGIGFSTDALDTPLSDALLLTIPVAAVGAATGALAGHWMARVVLAHRPSPLFAVIEGAGLGLLSGVFVGSATFAVNFLIAQPLLDVPDGYWGRFDPLPTVGLALVAGGFWGGLLGMAGGAVLLPIVALLMEF